MAWCDSPSFTEASVIMVPLLTPVETTVSGGRMA